MIELRLKSSFPPVTDGRTRLLILGSLPGEESLRRGQYYANPHNAFWRLIGAVIGTEFPASYDERLELLRGAGIGLWDTVRSASRVGSLDGAIRNLQANPLAAFVTELPALRVVAFNGAKASAIGRAQLVAAEGISLVTLPSSSPARAMRFDDKLAEWMRLRAWLPLRRSFIG